jgi:hypothetical protein
VTAPSARAGRHDRGAYPSAVGATPPRSRWRGTPPSSCVSRRRLRRQLSWRRGEEAQCAFAAPPASGWGAERRPTP